MCSMMIQLCCEHNREVILFMLFGLLLRMFLFKATCTFISPVFNLIFYCFIFALISFIENLVYF